MRRMAGALGVAVALAACGGDGGAGGVDELTISGVWARPTVAAQPTGAVYLTIESPVDDALVAVEVGPEVAGAAMVHGTEHHADDTVSMAMLGRVELPSGERVELAPNAMHVMLEGLTQPLAAGSAFELRLVFAEAGARTVTVEVSDDAP